MLFMLYTFYHFSFDEWSFFNDFRFFLDQWKNELAFIFLVDNLEILFVEIFLNFLFISVNIDSSNLSRFFFQTHTAKEIADQLGFYFMPEFKMEHILIDRYGNDLRNFYHLVLFYPFLKNPFLTTCKYYYQPRVLYQSVGNLGILRSIGFLWTSLLLLFLKSAGATFLF